MPAKRRRTTKDYDRIDFRGLRDLRSVTINSDTGKSFTQGEIAARAEMHQQTYGKIELGDTYNPSEANVRKIAAAFSRSYAELLNAMPVREKKNRDFVQQYIPAYAQSSDFRGYQYFDGVIKDNAQQVEEPPYLRNCNGYAVTITSDTMRPRYKAGDIVFCNPEIEPQRGDDVCIQLQYADHTICIVRELVDMQPFGIAKIDLNAYTYGVMTASEIDELRCANYKAEHYNDWIEDMGYLLPQLEWFVEQDPEDESRSVIDGKKDEAIKTKDNTEVTVADLNRMADRLGASGLVRAIDVHTIVGSQRYRSPRQRRNVFMEAEPLTMKAEVGQVTVSVSRAGDT